MFNSRATPSSATPATPSGNQRAAVPISVYRELAAELQDAQAEITALQQQNQKLLQQNQHLRQETEKISLACRNIERLSSEYAGDRPLGSQTPALDARSSDRLDRVSPSLTASAGDFELPKFSVSHGESAFSENAAERLVGEVSTAPLNQAESESSRDASVWLLSIAIALIALITVGVAFLALRPLLTNSGSNN